MTATSRVESEASTGATVTESPASLVDRLRGTFASGRTKSLQWRKEQLLSLRALLTDHTDELVAAMRDDMRKSTAEGTRMEVGGPVREIDEVLMHLPVWMSRQPVPTPFQFPGATVWTEREPFGVVLVISPWNYPVNLLLDPVIGALAAGNCVIAKPSEVAPATSATISMLLREYMPSDTFAVVEGGVTETTQLLAQRFDYIFYTGSGVVGRIVMEAAAKNLTPLTLELGGKSPTYVERGIDPVAVGTRLMRTKLTNAGQTCVAPDYVLTDTETAGALVPAMRDATRELYGENPASSPNYGRIVNEHHFDRLIALLDSGTVAMGGEHDRAERYIAPTVLTDVAGDSPVMQQEIFGPILPIITTPSLDDAIAFINERDKPLALYGFYASETTRDRLLAETSSGGAAFGLPMAQLATAGLPFGGVGESGMGQYHGRYSFETFSHIKGVVDQPVDSPLAQ